MCDSYQNICYWSIGHWLLVIDPLAIDLLVINYWLLVIDTFIGYLLKALFLHLVTTLQMLHVCIMTVRTSGGSELNLGDTDRCCHQAPGGSFEKTIDRSITNQCWQLKSYSFHLWYWRMLRGKFEDSVINCFWVIASEPELTAWLTDWLTDWLTHSLTDSLTDWLPDSQLWGYKPC